MAEDALSKVRPEDQLPLLEFVSGRFDTSNFLEYAWFLPMDRGSNQLARIIRASSWRIKKCWYRHGPFRQCPVDVLNIRTRFNFLLSEERVRSMAAIIARNLGLQHYRLKVCAEGSAGMMKFDEVIDSSASLITPWEIYYLHLR